MYEYIVEFMDENEIIFKNQFGFHENHSTQHAVISLIHTLFIRKTLIKWLHPYF